MLSVVRDKNAPADQRMDAAKGAAPYVHPKLNSTTITGANGGPVEFTEIRRTIVDPAAT
jgi:hypothetical protein